MDVGYGLFTDFGEWVVSPGNGTKSKMETRESVRSFKWQITCVG